MATTRGLAARIRAALQAARVSQASLARHVGVSRQLVNLWVTEDDAKRLEPTAEQLGLIAQRLGVTEAWLRGTSRDGPVPKAADTNAAYDLQHRHSAGKRWRIEFEEALAAAGGVRQLNAQLPSGTVLPVVAVDNDTVIVPMEHRTDPEALRAMCWMLTLLRDADTRLGLRRRYIVAVGALPPASDNIVAEARAQGIDIVAEESGAAAATGALALDRVA